MRLAFLIGGACGFAPRALPRHAVAVADGRGGGGVDADYPKFLPGGLGNSGPMRAASVRDSGAAAHTRRERAPRSRVELKR